MTESLWQTATHLIPTGTQTFSKMPNQFAEGISPKFIERGEGAWLWDVDNRKYLDYVGALGPIVLGYNYMPVNEAIRRQLDKGIIFSMASPLEVELAKLLTTIIPSAEMVKFGKNGNDVTSAAVRLARAFTGREKIAMCGYHGWQDWYTVTTIRNRGIPACLQELSLPFRYNDIESLRQLFKEHPGEIAAVIMEPVGVIEPENDFLQSVNELAHSKGALLIFDEVKTGFRCHLGGAQSLYGVIPDLSCFGKAMANGMPMSAVVGRRDVMELFQDIFFSMQAGGELLSIAASIATIKELERTDAIDRIRESGTLLKKGCQELLERHGLSSMIGIVGLPHYTVFTFERTPAATHLEIKTLFIQEAARRGILTGGYSILSLAHTPAIIQETLAVYDNVFGVIREAVDSADFRRYLACPVVAEIFRKP